jgi:hypothetical protein
MQAIEHSAAIGETRWARIVATVVVLWGIGVAMAAWAGAYRALPTLGIGPIIVAGIVLPALAYFLVDGFRRYIRGVGLRALTALQIWRIFAALAFFWYGAHDRLPPAFVQEAAWGDLAAGLAALIVTLLPERRARYFVAHIIGFTDFVVALGLGMTFILMHDPRMETITVLPLALIPLYGVGISGATHIMAFDLLRRGVGLSRDRR